VQIKTENSREAKNIINPKFSNNFKIILAMGSRQRRRFNESVVGFYVCEARGCNKHTPSLWVV